MKLPQGTTLYHGTSFVHAVSIINEGLQLVDSAWGQAELGPGFYTSTTLAGAASYLKGGGRHFGIRDDLRNGRGCYAPSAQI